MKILSNLNDEQLTELLLESDEKLLRRHIGDLPEFARINTERDESFWQQQRMSINAKIGSPKIGVWGLLPLLTGAAAVAILAFTMLSSSHHRTTPVVHVQVQAPTDHDLLLQVEESTESNGPEALQPAALLAGEISQNAVGSTAAGHLKEKSTNEN